MIILPSIFESFRSLKDKGYKLLFESNELTPEQMVGLNESLGQFGYLAFKIDPFKQSEKDVISKLESDFDDKKKSKAQRLRGVLYRNWEQKPEGYEDSERYYDFYMEKFINHQKNKLV